VRADFHEGRDFRKNIQINITRLYKNTKTKKEELFTILIGKRTILSVFLVNRNYLDSATFTSRGRLFHTTAPLYI
jgi:hypothetical protein